MNTLSVLAVDDEPLALLRLEQVVQRIGEAKLVGAASGCADALEQVRELRPDVLLLDISMRDGSGFDLIKRLPAEGAPAIINRIEIVGNDYTTEQCIRDQLVILPGDVYNQQRLIQSWQSIGNLGFFETPLPPSKRRYAACSPIPSATSNFSPSTTDPSTRRRGFWTPCRNATRASG